MSLDFFLFIYIVDCFLRYTQEYCTYLTVKYQHYGGWKTGSAGENHGHGYVPLYCRTYSQSSFI